MTDESATPDLVELFRLSVEAFNRSDLDAYMGVVVRVTDYVDIDEARAAAERLPEESG